MQAVTAKGEAWVSEKGGGQGREYPGSRRQKLGGEAKTVAGKHLPPLASRPKRSSGTTACNTVAEKSLRNATNASVPHLIRAI